MVCFASYATVTIRPLLRNPMASTDVSVPETEMSSMAIQMGNRSATLTSKGTTVSPHTAAVLPVESFKPASNPDRIQQR